MSSSWRLVSLGDRKHRLETASGRALGWIHGHAVGLFGLRDETEALTWAPSLRLALDDALARQYPERYQPVRDFSNLRLVHDGAYEWIAAGEVPLARVHRPSKRGENRFALEFVLPSYASERAATAAARILATTLYERILSPSFMRETEERNHVGTAESAQRPPGDAARRRRERVTRQFPRERPTEVEQSPARAAHAFRGGSGEGRGAEQHG